MAFLSCGNGTSGGRRDVYMIYGDASAGFVTGVYFRAEDLEGFTTVTCNLVSGTLSYYFYKKDSGENTRFTSPLNLSSIGSFSTLVIGAGANTSVRATVMLN